MRTNLIFILSIAGNLLALLIAIYAIQRLGGIRNVWYKLKNPDVVSQQVHRKSIFDMLEIDSTAIVMLGNSLTAYCEWSELMGNEKIVNRGIPGETLAGIRQRLPRILDQKPNMVFLMIGINDLMYHDAEWVINEYRALLESISSTYPETRLIIQEILPVNETVQSLPTANEEIKKVNKALVEMTDLYDLKLLPLFDQFVDANGQLDSSFTLDGVHLTGAAYLVWKAALEKKINETPD